jgi:mono/diheme cytochrome c family protein
VAHHAGILTVRRSLLLLIVLLAASACGTDRRGLPAREPLALSEAATRGQAVFMHQCNHCHPRGQAGLAFALNNKPLPGPLIAFQVRRGLGAMPAFPEEVISDAALDDLVIYLRELRRGG